MPRVRPRGPLSAPPPPADLSIGAFSDHPPWLVEPDGLPWRIGLELVREETRAAVPRLVRRRRFPPWRRIVRVTAILGWALAGWYFVDRRRKVPGPRAGLSHRLRFAFQRLGPTYIKLGQILSSGEGIFPAELVGEFKLLRDRVPAESFDVVRECVEADLGRPLEEVFSEFSPEPVAAASIAQVHRARLSSGEEVVVKVQRPRVAALVKNDLAVMSYLAPHLVGRIPVAVLANPPALIELFAETIVEELDFRLEAESMLDVAGAIAAAEQRTIVVPRPHPRLVTPRVLVMERLDGFAWDDVGGMRDAGIATEKVMRAAVVSFLEGVMLFGVFHGDLHGGNLFVRPDGRVALLDFGITGRLDETHRLAFLRLVMGATMNDVRSQVTALRDLGALAPEADLDQVIVDLGLDGPPQDVTEMSAEELTRQMRELTRQLLAYGAKMPKELMLFVKNILFLDGVIATFAPDVDLLGEVVEIAGYFARRYGDRIAREIGLDPAQAGVDLDGVRAAIGVSATTEQISYRELQARREAVRRKFRRQP
ncbi:MAG TPA: AarF/UbiB family protein [Acidimicrobiales bacterium]|nr:AarF/UbiB family protein [Acidimicrobiales bacterium]